MRRALLLILSILSALASFSQITGVAPHYAGRNIYLIEYAEYITSREVVIAKEVIDKDGFFHFNFQPKVAGKFILRSEGISGHIYLQPNSPISIYFPDPDPNQPITTGYTHFVQVSSDTSADKLNHNISLLNQSVDEFLNINYKLLIQKKGAKATSEFIVSTSKKFGKVPSTFFRTYMQYSFASLRKLAGTPASVLASEYLAGKEIHYSNPEYMNFFNQYFDNYLGKIAMSVKHYKIKESINNHSDYKKILVQMGAADTLLQDKALAELVLLKGLYELYYNKDFKQYSIGRLLRDIREHSQIAESKSIAESILQRVEGLASGKPAPSLVLRDLQGREFSLASLKGKPVVVTFWTTGCGECIQEMKVMRSLETRYQDKVQFVYVPIDRNIDAQKKIYRAEALLGTKLLDGSDYELKESFAVRLVPLFYVLDSDGNLVRHPAPPPSRGLDEILHNLTR